MTAPPGVNRVALLHYSPAPRRPPELDYIPVDFPVDPRIAVYCSRMPFALLFATALAGALGGCAGDTDEQTARLAAVVGTRVVLQDSYALEHEYTGTLAALQHDDLGFELGGTLNALRVDEGDRVSRGQVLAELDTQLLEAERRQLEAQLSENDARIGLVAANLGREQKLKRSGFAAEQQLDELRAQQQALAATQQRLRATLESNTVRLAKSRIEAPFDGVITARYRDTGAPVVPGMPVLRLMDATTPEARVGVPARLAPRLKPGTELPVRIGAAQHTATVITRGAEIDPVTRTLTVRLALPPVAGAAVGELLGLRVAEDVPARGAWLPVSAITEGLRGLWVTYALVPDGEGVYRIEARDVEVIHAGQEQLFVNGALADGEQVVGAALQRVTPGQRVRIAPAEAP